MLQRIKQIKYLGIKILLISFVILAAIDLYTAYLTKPYLPYVETNPFYILFGNLTLSVIFTVVVVFVLFHLYKVVSPFLRFLFCGSMVFSALLRYYAIQSNLKVYYNPPTPEQITYLIETLTPAAKLQAYSVFTTTNYFIPIFLCLAVYLFWRIDNDVENKDYKYN